MNHEIKPNLKKIMQKLLKKDRELYNEVFSKIEEITNSVSIEHYKNLKYSRLDCKFHF